MVANFITQLKSIVSKYKGLGLRSEDSGPWRSWHLGSEPCTLEVLPDLYACVKHTYAPRRGLMVEDAGDRKVSSDGTVAGSHYHLLVTKVLQTGKPIVPISAQSAL